MSLAWFFVFLAGFFEICFTITLKYSQGFTRLVPSIIAIIFIALSFFTVSQSMKILPIGTAYGIWAGIGAVGTVTAGIILFGDSCNIVRIASLLLIIIGILGLKLGHFE